MAPSCLLLWHEEQEPGSGLSLITPQSGSQIPEPRIDGLPRAPPEGAPTLPHGSAAGSVPQPGDTGCSVTRLTARWTAGQTTSKLLCIFLPRWKQFCGFSFFIQTKLLWGCLLWFWSGQGL